MSAFPRWPLGYIFAEGARITGDDKANGGRYFVDNAWLTEREVLAKYPSAAGPQFLIGNDGKRSIKPGVRGQMPSAEDRRRFLRGAS